MESREEVMHLRARLKTNPEASEALKKALAETLKAKGIEISDELLKSVIIAVPDELGGVTDGVPILPVPNINP